MTIRAVVVDVGGVLERNPPTGWVEQWETRLGLEPGGLAERVSPIWRPGRVGAASLPAIERETADALGLDTRDSEQLWADVWDEYLGTLNVELFRMITSLPRRYSRAILSNSFVGAREREQALYGFEDVFDHVIYSHEEGMEKPDPDVYRLACARLGVAPPEAVFIDDLPENVSGAEAVGMQAILFECTEQTIRSLHERLAEV
jgi:epoxide hydrolase-like predicted phosphatase